MNLSIKGDLSLISEKKLDIKKLNKNQYIISLLQEGLKSSVITSSQVLNIQTKIMDLLKALILKYTKGESTSVTVETTESLLNSLLYSLDFRLLKFENPLLAIRYLFEKDLNKIYEEGLELLRLCVSDTKKLCKQVNKYRLNLDIDAYNETLDVAIPSFFEKYTIVFEAHHSMASIDYPLVFDDMSVRGVSYIRNYLETLNIETKFCRLFPEEDLEKLIKGFGRMCRLNSKIELINIFEIVINNCMFSVLCGNKLHQLNITPNQYNTLEEIFKLSTLNSINTLIDKSVDTIIKGFNIINRALIKYINNYKELFKRRVINSLENNCLSSIVVIDEEKGEEKLAFTFDEGKRMGEDDFRLIISKIIKTSEINDKVNIVTSTIHSLQDFIDILNGDCFFGEEVFFIFNTLGDIELTILTKLVFYEELRDGVTNLLVISGTERETEFEWQNYFIKFIDSLSVERKNKIQELITKVDYEEIKFY